MDINLNGYGNSSIAIESNGNFNMNVIGGIYSNSGSNHTITLTAQWEKLQEITLSDNGGSGGSGKIYYDKDTQNVYDNSSNIITTVNIPLKSKYIFKGYKAANSIIIDETGLINKENLRNINNAHSGDLTITAEWIELEEQGYQEITLNDNLGTGGSGKIYYDHESENVYDSYGKVITTVNVPTRSSFIFDGYEKDR